MMTIMAEPDDSSEQLTLSIKLPPLEVETTEVAVKRGDTMRVVRPVITGVGWMVAPLPLPGGTTPVGVGPYETLEGALSAAGALVTKLERRRLYAEAFNAELPKP